MDFWWRWNAFKTLLTINGGVLYSKVPLFWNKNSLRINFAIEDLYCDPELGFNFNTTTKNHLLFPTIVTKHGVSNPNILEAPVLFLCVPLLEESPGGIDVEDHQKCDSRSCSLIFYRTKRSKITYWMIQCLWTSVPVGQVGAPGSPDGHDPLANGLQLWHEAVRARGGQLLRGTE